MMNVHELPTTIIVNGNVIEFNLLRLRISKVQMIHRWIWIESEYI